MTLERNLKKLQESKNLQEREEMNLQLVIPIMDNFQIKWN